MARAGISCSEIVVLFGLLCFCLVLIGNGETKAEGLEDGHEGFEGRIAFGDSARYRDSRLMPA